VPARSFEDDDVHGTGLYRDRPVHRDHLRAGEAPAIEK
jgi:hypothetical protein